MSSVKLTNIRKSYADHTVLDDVTLTIEDGEFVSLLGPSGCGKTTLLRIVAGLQSFDSGRVELHGVDVSQTPAEKRGIGMVFQQYTLFPNMNVRKNIAFPLTAARLSKAAIRERVDELVEIIGLQEHQHKYPKELSGGQQQRVALGRALAPNPSILLLDEPLSALDAKVRSRLRDQIREIQQELGITALFVTHDQNEALAMSDRIVLMGDAGILQVDEPREIYAHPAHREGANFVGRRNEVSVTATSGRLQWLGLIDVPSPVPDAQTVTCSFRAESLKVALAPDTQVHTWRSATVEARTYLGSTSILKLRLSDGTRLNSVVTGSLAVQIRDQDLVYLHLRPQDVNIYANDHLVAVGEVAK